MLRAMGDDVRRCPRASRAVCSRVLVAAAACAGLAAAALPVGALAAMPVGSPHLVIESVYAGTVTATGKGEDFRGVHTADTTLNFTVTNTLLVDNAGHTQEQPTVHATGTSTGIEINEADESVPFSCTLSADTATVERLGPIAITPAAGQLAPTESEQFSFDGGPFGRAFTSNPAGDYASINVQSYVPIEAGEAHSSGSGASCAKETPLQELPVVLGGFEHVDLLPFYTPELKDIQVSALPISVPENSDLPFSLPSLKEEGELSIHGTLTVSDRTDQTIVFHEKSLETVHKIETQQPPPKPPPPEEGEDQGGALIEPCAPATTGVAASRRQAHAQPQPKLSPRDQARALCAKIDPRKLKIIRDLKFSPANVAARNRIKAQLKAAIKVKTEECSNSYQWKNASDFSSVVPSAPGVKTPTAPKHFTVLDFAAYANLKVCLGKLRDLQDELAVAEADPPLSSFGTVSLPEAVPAEAPGACDAHGLTADELAKCDGARTALRDVQLEGDRLVAIGQAIALSIDRHGGAAKARNLAGVELQEDAYDAQVAELAQVIDRYNAARLAFAHALAGLGVDIAFSPRFTARPAAYLRSAGKHATGEERAALQLMAHLASAQRLSFGSSYTGDLSEALPSGLPHVAPTPRDVNPLVQQLAGAGEIPRALASTIGGELKELTTAAGPARTALLRKLGANFRAIRSGAGPMLEALTGIQSPRL